MRGVQEVTRLQEASQNGTRDQELSPLSPRTSKVRCTKARPRSPSPTPCVLE